MAIQRHFYKVNIYSSNINYTYSLFIETWDKDHQVSKACGFLYQRRYDVALSIVCTIPLQLYHWNLHNLQIKDENNLYNYK